MAAKLTVAQRAEYGTYAWKLSLKGVSAPAIATKIAEKYEHPISEKAVDRLLAAEGRKNEKRYDRQKEQARARYHAEQFELYADAWRRAGQRGLNPNVAVAFQRNAMQASTNMAKAAGVFVDQVDVTSGGESLVCRYIGVDIDQV